MELDRAMLSVSGMVGREDVLDQADCERMKEAIFKTLSTRDPQTVVELDFTFVRYITVACGNVVTGVIRRLVAGEYPGVFITLTGLKRQHKGGNISLPLRMANLAVVVRDELDETFCLGRIQTAYAEALSKAMIMKTTTARELKDSLNYNTVNEASTKLCALYGQRLLAREPATGKSFRYMGLM